MCVPQPFGAPAGQLPGDPKSHLDRDRGRAYRTVKLCLLSVSAPRAEGVFRAANLGGTFDDPSVASVSHPALHQPARSVCRPNSPSIRGYPCAGIGLSAMLRPGPLHAGHLRRHHRHLPARSLQLRRSRPLHRRFLRIRQFGILPALSERGTNLRRRQFLHHGGHVLRRWRLRRNPPGRRNALR